MNIAAQTRTGLCPGCLEPLEQTLACEDPPSYLPKFHNETCEQKRLDDQRRFLGRIDAATNDHLLKNRLANANLSGRIARGEVTMDNAADGYAEATGRSRNTGVTSDRYREVATAIKDFVSVPPLLRVDGIASIAYVYGPEGTGKSFLAEVAAAHVVHKLERRALYMPLMDMLSEIRSAFEKDGETEAHAIAQYYGADLLVIDDVTRRLTPTHWELETLLRVVDQRLRMRRPTIFTANYDVPGLFKLWSNADDERVTKLVRLLCDRLADTKNAISLPMVGRSLRRG